MATPSTTGLRWATAACSHPIHPASDAQSAALGEHLGHCRTRVGQFVGPFVSRPLVSSKRVFAPAQRRRLAALLAHAARLIR